MKTTVTVRIAVAVDESGHWNSCGWKRAMGEDKNDHEAELMGLAVDPLGEGEARYWIEAVLPLPGVPTIVGAVEQA